MRFYLFILLLGSLQVSAQDFTLSLWTDSIPNYRDNDQEEEFYLENNLRIIKNVQNPNIAVYLPAKENATGEAVIICPGGGYWVLVYDREGSDFAKTLNKNGIAVIILKYRLPTSNNYITRHKSPLLDAQRAFRLVRYHAKYWNIKTNKIGIMGFSAGGHLAATLSTHFDDGNQQATDSIERMSCRPDFSILVYPVISFVEEFSHKGSAKALLGDNPSQELLTYFSNELQVTEQTPPAFLVHSTDDKIVSVKNSLAYYNALHKNNIPAEIHIYPYGGHGFSLATNKGYLSSWIDICAEWVHYISKEKN